ncbi:hypothetical protein [Haliangium ochraceum]|uniref:Uncharacterized protein n=1 Tax=Haliangium ochraceum (strain DSM 14365 / JCM 11303 / SMP-2) TaxID=502025 RepID=D0LHV8_HALO1|nr:hypothetical protein [Haliangium ochraceum]ACY14787.1 hypothetical protein Hoch_2244 [Haliangium ochraceum DSM 14365]
MAQHLANKLGVNVMAPSATAWIHPDDRVTIGRSPTDDSGAWNSFDPGNRFQEGTPGNANQQPVADADASSVDSGNSVDTADGVNADTGPPGGLEPAPDGPAVAAGVASPEATAAAQSLAGRAAGENVAKFAFDPSEVDAVKQQAREDARVAAEAAYDTAIADGKSPKQAHREAKMAAKAAARQRATAEAQRAARDMARQAIANGGAFDPSKLDADANAQLTNYQSGSFEAQRIAPAVAGMSDANFQTFMANEVSTGAVPAPQSRNISAPNPPPALQAMLIWEYPDGTVVRYKPLGDERRPNPTYSIEMKKNPSLPDSGPDDAAFKVGSSGTAVPKNAFEALNPFSLQTNAIQFHAFEDGLMNAGHLNLTP